MAVYAIGDVQGCYEELRSLLERIAFDPERDRLWFVGDLVNRGPRSLDTLRFVRDLGERALVVLGNHDLHLLAVVEGVDKVRREDRFGDVRQAPDRDELLAWLRRRPLLHRNEDLGFTMVHAGLPPQWDVDEAAERAAEVEAALRDDAYRTYLKHMYGDEPARWSPELEGWARLRFITNALTRMRYCDDRGRLVFGESGPPGTQPPGCHPWFAVSGRKSRSERIVFGHWATLQLERPVAPQHRVYHLDRGCVWGGSLTALRLDDQQWFAVPCRPSHAAR
ncbi:MAG: symmetrical bis(5'-nucleosyl)-tetraphosphatase [Gammaproteobacteria bacterium]|nr:symmetrical bis(5'-nucleosyl)-tetraphosphatase [Gammaproteobacteria bacterium]NIR82009.1 symmetrical bis(5'-nucleosyl)-tetraphosphatase [Gammaproteobacteria bacterium]NIR89069.1 symmetrical bis(5'-nucleosyl)-tetraphosphatase [Gammaproteobacteria bacterium]NIU03116.1 symmetrical bis(5'-nucleosyl)-tetraphosphatase [Gammaproteobacteria bacterium]NIX84391.1 symmetrical bis(5'-nucleosyl)-tetraphosphatase [Gammaproteobacteria bacterium]